MMMLEKWEYARSDDVFKIRKRTNNIWAMTRYYWIMAVEGRSPMT